jgi:hypothetical protein
MKTDGHLLVVGNFGILGTTIQLLGTFGHHHNKREKIVHMQTSTRKRRGTSISKNSVDWRRDGRAVDKNGWVFVGLSVGFWVQLYYYWELSATTTKEKQSCSYG